MKVVGQTLTWAELADSFVQHVFMPARMAPLLERALPERAGMRLTIPGGEAQITVDVGKPRLLRPLADVFRIDLPLSVVIDGEVLGGIDADARLRVVVPLFVRIEPRWPLVLFLNVRPVQADEVAVSQEAASPLFKLANGLRQIPDLKATIADAVNREVEASLQHRTIDLLAHLDTAAPERGDAAGQEASPVTSLANEYVPSAGWTFVEPATIEAALLPRR